MKQLLSLVLILMCPSLYSAQEQLSVEQREVLERILDWIVDPQGGNGHLPDRQDITAERFGYSYNRLLSFRQFRPDGEKQHRAVFASADDFWQALYEVGLSRHIKINLFDPAVRARTKAFSSFLHQLMHQLVHEWIVDHPGRLPEEKDFGFARGQIAVPLYRIIPAPRSRKQTSFYPNIQEFWFKQKAFTEDQGATLSLLALDFEAPLIKRVRLTLQDEALDLTVRWMQNNGGRQPDPLDFGRPLLPLNWSRLTGTGEYADALREWRIFDSPREFTEALESHLEDLDHFAPAQECRALL